MSNPTPFQRNAARIHACSDSPEMAKLHSASLSERYAANAAALLVPEFRYTWIDPQTGRTRFCEAYADFNEPGLPDNPERPKGCWHQGLSLADPSRIAQVGLEDALIQTASLGNPIDLAFARKNHFFYLATAKKDLIAELVYWFLGDIDAGYLVLSPGSAMAMTVAQWRAQRPFAYAARESFREAPFAQAWLQVIGRRDWMWGFRAKLANPCCPKGKAHPYVIVMDHAMGLRVLTP